MGPRFKKFFRVTKGFLVLRLLVAVAVSLIYIFVAAGIQYAFVSFFGENTFNYIAGGLLSLFLGVLVCKGVGAIFFMFIKGWHVAALAYVDKIEEKGLSPLDVGVRAFFKNLVSFGAVYGVRTLLKNVLADFKVKLWEISDEIPYGATLRRFASHPITEYLAGDILHYAFDASIFYLVGNPPEELNEIPSTVLTAVKKYLYCIPSILISSVQTYLLFRFLPKFCKYMLLLWVFLTEGLIAGVLITVLMFPLFYIMDNAIFDPLTMMVFVATYSKKCNKDLDPNDPVVIAVEQILNNEEPTGSSEESEEDEAPKQPKKSARKERPQGSQSTSGEDFVDVGEEDAHTEPAPASASAATPSNRAAAAASVAASCSGLLDIAQRLESLHGMMDKEVSRVRPSEEAEDVSTLPLSDADFQDEAPAPVGGPDIFKPSVVSAPRPNPFAVLREQDSAGLDDDPLAGMFEPE